MKKEVKFNETLLIGGMREALAHAGGKLPLKTTRRRLRASTGIRRSRIPTSTIKKWVKDDEVDAASVKIKR